MDSVEVALPETDAGSPIPPEPITSFDQLDLSPPLLRAVQEAGWEKPTPIQLDAIPVALSGRDLIACAQTGTGKTGAFALPILERLKEGGGGAGHAPWS